VHKDYLNELFICSKTNCTKISCCHFLKTETKENYVSLEEKSYVISPEDFWVQEQGTATVAWGKLYDINLFKDIRYPEGRIHEDEFTTYKLLFNNDYISVSPRELYYYFQSPVSIMRSKWSEKKLDGLEAYENQMLYFSQNKFKNALKESTKLHTYALKNNFSIIKDSGQKEYKKLIYKMIGNFLYKKYHFKFLKMIFFCKLFIYNRYFTLFFNVRFFVAKKIYKRNGIKGLFNKANSIIAKYLIKYRKKH
ncbi:MAG: hypothetical protein MJ076_04700, partial [Clostridia bacterium]|nr:hypothetical protein [Clostridia bacterium]